MSVESLHVSCSESFITRVYILSLTRATTEPLLQQTLWLGHNCSLELVYVHVYGF